MTAAIIIQSNPIGVRAEKSPALFLPDQKSGERFYSFFTANIRNPNTRRAYYKAACRFSEWCEGRGLLDLAHVKPPQSPLISKCWAFPCLRGAVSLSLR